MKTLKYIATIALCALALNATGCSRANYAAASAWGRNHHVQLYSGGKLIGEWETTGKIENEEHSNGYYFQDEKTGKMVMIDGQVIITVD